MVVLLPVLAVALWSSPALGQGDCRIPGTGEDSVWVSVAPLAGVSITIPTADPMSVRRTALAFGGEVTLNLPKRFAVGAQVSYAHFDGQMSLVQWVSHMDMLAVGHIPLIVTERFDWILLAAAGTSLVRKQFLHNPKPHVSDSGEVTYSGEVRRGNIWTLTGGLGTRLVVYPADPVGIFAQALVTYAYFKALERSEGPCTAQITGGVEVHF